MDPEEIHDLEKHLEKAIAESLKKFGRKRLTWLASRHTRRMMAKAAAAVYEAAVDEHERET
jgi:transcription initiation factor TFIIIB Brf1 subunit/transcription initiation factor TFIIB